MDYIIWIECLLWIVCGIISYGFDFAYYQREYSPIAKKDYKEDRIICVFFALLGPINLIEIIIRKNYKHGLKYK